MFEQLIGQAPIKQYLERALLEGKLPHALLFVGPVGVGKKLFAQELATHLLCAEKERIEKEIHPDFHPIRVQGKGALHAIEAFRAMIEEVHKVPFEAPAKVFLIHDAERMQPAAANALLKTLEEPAPNTFLILITTSSSSLLPTILSRCIRLTFKPLSEEEVASFLSAKGLDPKWARLSQGSLSRAYDLATTPAVEEPLFRLLSQRSPYHEVSLALEKMEKGMQDEDPLKRARLAERLFASLFIWFRDQHLRRLGVEESHLFLPEEPAVSFPLPSLEKVQKALDEAKQGLERNIKLSACLEHFLFKLF